MSRASITVKFVGDGNFRRYFIVRPSDWWFWTGAGWSPERRQALLYAHLPEAHEDYQLLIVQPYRDKPLREFRANLQITVRTDNPFTLQELVDYLNRAFQGIVDTDASGDGPVSECLVLIRAHFEDLREVPPQQQ